MRRVENASDSLRMLQKLRAPTGGGAPPPERHPRLRLDVSCEGSSSGPLLARRARKAAVAALAACSGRCICSGGGMQRQRRPNLDRRLTHGGSFRTGRWRSQRPGCCFAPSAARAKSRGAGPELVSAAGYPQRCRSSRQRLEPALRSCRASRYCKPGAACSAAWGKLKG